MNGNLQLSYAGSWRFNTGSTSAGLVDFYSTIHLGSSKAEGLVLAGWAIPSTTAATPMQTTVAVLDQNADGTLKINTAKYIQNPLTNGIGSVIVTDFNGDGVDDIFLASYNERPDANEQTTVYLSSGVDTFTKTLLPDLTSAHSAILTTLNSVKTVVTTGYADLTDPYFQFNAATKTFDIKQWGNSSSGKLLGSSAVTGDFLGDGHSELVVVDTHPLNNWGAYTASQTVMYGLNSTQAGTSIDASQVSVLPKPYFNDNPNFPGRTTHQYRVWTDDFNHDGKLDLMVGESTMVADWSTSTATNASKIQMLQNQGGLVFKDATDALGGAYVSTTNNVDYSAQFLDLDHSGINSYLLGDSPLGPGSTQSNYLLLNDGTGKLYAALHDEFLGLGAQVKAYLDQSRLTYNPALSPKFIAYQTPEGVLNYVADVATGDGVTVNLVNVPLRYSPTSDFTQNITVADRNNSLLMRTWAGSDTFTDTNANSAPAHIDGGLGLDTSIYSKPSSSYHVTRSADGSTSVVGNGLSDTLVNVERLQFPDKTVALDINGTAGQAYRIYQAAFNRTPDNGGLKYWIGIMDSGVPLTTVSSGFIGSAEFQKLYGTNPTNELFVTKLYDNVLHRTPDAGGYNYWVGLLNSGGIDKVSTLVNFSESNENQAGVIGVIQNGIDLFG